MGEKKMALFGTPGLELWKSLGDGEIRALLTVGDYLYVVRANQFQRVSTAGVVEDLGVLNNSTGIIGMESNGIDITIVGGGWGYTYVIATDIFAEIVDADFPGGNNIVYIDGYYLVNKPDTGQIWRSDYNDGSSWEALAFSTAGGDPDDIVSIIVDHRDIWVIGENSTEIWYNTGDATFNFARIEGAFIEQGGMALFARTKINNAVYWLGQDKFGNAQVFEATSRQPKIVSTSPINYAISQCDMSDAFMFSYQQLGHNFVVLTFPSSDLTVVYDTTTELWHKRSSKISGVDRRWRVNAHAVFNGDHIVGDYSNGKLYKMKTDVYDEDGTPMVSTRITGVVRKNQNRITINELQVVNEPGVGLIVGGGGGPEDIDPQALISWSKDGGRTWGTERDMPLGKIGEYGNESRVYQLGQGINWSFKYVISAAVKKVVLGAVADVEVDDG
jgi:hypothetical protein